MSARADQLSALLARVEALKKADPELDGAIYIRFFGSGAMVSPPEGRLFVEAWGTPSYTASLDAALALCERVLPGAWVLIDTRAQDGRPAAVVGRGEDTPMGVRSGATPAIALLAAMLKAVLASNADTSKAEEGLG